MIDDLFETLAEVLGGPAPKPTRYHIVEVGSWCVALPALWMRDLDGDSLLRSNLTREEAVEWEGLRPDRIGSGATVLDHKTPDDLREHMKAGDIESLHWLTTRISDAHDEGWISSRTVARLLGGA